MAEIDARLVAVGTWFDPRFDMSNPNSYIRRTKALHAFLERYQTNRCNSIILAINAVCTAREYDTANDYVLNNLLPGLVTCPVAPWTNYTRRKAIIYIAQQCGAHYLLMYPTNAPQRYVFINLRSHVPSVPWNPYDNRLPVHCLN